MKQKFEMPDMDIINFDSEFLMGDSTEVEFPGEEPDDLIKW